jgi:hypothetical protein
MSILGALKRWERFNSAHGWLERPLKYSFDASGVKGMILVFRSSPSLLGFNRI